MKRVLFLLSLFIAGAAAAQASTAFHTSLGDTPGTTTVYGPNSAICSGTPIPVTWSVDSPFDGYTTCSGSQYTVWLDASGSCPASAPDAGILVATTLSTSNDSSATTPATFVLADLPGVTAGFCDGSDAVDATFATCGGELLGGLDPTSNIPDVCTSPAFYVNSAFSTIRLDNEPPTVGTITNIVGQDQQVSISVGGLPANGDDLGNPPVTIYFKELAGGVAGDGGTDAGTDAGTATVVCPTSAVPDSTWSSVSPTGGSVNGPYSVPNLVDGTTYAFSVVIIDEAGNISPPSPVQCGAPVQGVGFWDKFQADGGNARCSATGGDVLALGTLALVMGWLARRRST